MTETVESIGQAIRKRRKETGYSIEDAAGLMNISYRTWSEIERGKKTAQISIVIKMCNAVGLDVCLVRRGHGQS